MPRSRPTATWTFLITSIALFMVALDNLVVTTALPVIKADLGASLADLQWMVNAYTLTFAVLLITGAALGDRFGRQRVFVIGIAIFTFGSAMAALAPSTEILIAASAIQGVGGAIITPLTLTLLSAAVPPERRAVALGAWGGIAGLAIAIGPLVGGAIAEGLDWHWIFWLNVPIGLVVLPLGGLRLTESRGPAAGLDVPGLGLVSAGLLAVVWGVINGNDRGWTAVPRSSARIVAAASSCWPASSPGRPGPPSRCSRSGSSGAARSPRPTQSRCSCTSGCSDRSSCSPSSSRSSRATARSRPACGRCRGRGCRSSWPRSRASSPVGSAAGRSSVTGMALQAVALGWLAA